MVTVNETEDWETACEAVQRVVKLVGSVNEIEIEADFYASDTMLKELVEYVQKARSEGETT